MFGCFSVTAPFFVSLGWEAWDGKEWDAGFDNAIRRAVVAEHIGHSLLGLGSTIVLLGRGLDRSVSCVHFFVMGMGIGILAGDVSRVSVGDGEWALMNDILSTRSADLDLALPCLAL